MYAEIPQLKRGIYAEMMGILESGGALVVQPAAHYFEGGVHVRSDMSTALPGLFAAGECAGGLFGANRVSAATTEMLVEGAVAGVTAACFAKDAPSGGELDQGCAAHVEEELLAPFGRTDGPDPVALVGALRETTGGAIGVIRNGIALDRASRGLADIAEALGRSSLSSMERRYNQQWRSYMELRAMLPCAQAIVASSMERQESRGVFVRSDCPNTDNEFCLFNVLVTPDGSTLRKSVELVRAQPERGVWSYQDYIQKTVDEMD